VNCVIEEFYPWNFIQLFITAIIATGLMTTKRKNLNHPWKRAMQVKTAIEQKKNQERFGEI